MKRPPNRGWNNLFQTVLGTTCPQPAKRIAITAAACLLITPTSRAIIDTNENGLSDLWEKQHNENELFPETFDPQADPDSDGWTNAQEAAAGTDPFDPNPPGGFLRPEILHTPAVLGEENGQPVIITPEAVTVSWPTLVGKQYTLQLSPGISENWITIGELFIGDGDIHDFGFTTDPADKNFYRVTVTDIDIDGDTLTNAEEHELGTDPNNPDTDGDGMQDGWEIQHGLDPSDDGSLNPDNGAAGDPDEDGIPNRHDSTPQVPDDFVVVIDTESRAYVPNHIGITQFERRVSLDRLMESGTVAIANYSSVTSGGIGEGTVEISDIAIEAREPVDEVQKFVLSNLLDLDDPSIFEEDYSVEVRPPIVLRIEVGQTMSNQVTVDAGYSDLANLPPTMNKAAYLDRMVAEWQPIEGWTNVDDHVEPPWDPAETVEKVNGKKIFPCLEDPFKTEIRHKLRVVVQASPLLKGKPIFVKSFDIDDSTSEAFDQSQTTGAPCIDTNGKSGGDNRKDYMDTDIHGMFWGGSAWGANTGNGTLNDEGKAEFHFRVGMQPGDNYKAAASVFDASMYSHTQFANATAPHYIGPFRTEDGDAPSTAMLTVWRKLWVENDSMAGPARIDLFSDNPSARVGGVTYVQNENRTGFTIPSPSDTSSFQKLENGRIEIGTSSYPVKNTVPNSDGTVTVIVDGDHSSVAQGSEFRLYDDDGYGLTSACLPKNSIVNDELKAIFKPAFIDVEDVAEWNENKLVDFYRNHPPLVGAWGFQTPGVWDDGIELSDYNNSWVANLVAGYQGDVGQDKDPNSDDSMEGVTPPSRKFSIVYVEAIRDHLDALFRHPLANNESLNYELFRNITLTAAHEIGHMPGGGNETSHHNEGLLMGSDGYGNGTTFSAETVRRFRKTWHWQQPQSYD